MIRNDTNPITGKVAPNAIVAYADAAKSKTANIMMIHEPRGHLAIGRDVAEVAVIVPRAAQDFCAAKAPPAGKPE
jgi:hypothetical protein